MLPNILLLRVLFRHPSWYTYTAKRKESIKICVICVISLLKRIAGHSTKADIRELYHRNKLGHLKTLTSTDRDKARGCAEYDGETIVYAEGVRHFFLHTSTMASAVPLTPVQR